MEPKRVIFLENFLQLVGVEKIEIILTETDKIFGKAIYSDNETQEFCWHITEEKVASEKALELLKLIKENNLIDIDKIKVSPEKLFKTIGWENSQKNNEILDELFDIEIKMIDDNEETDSYFLHN